METAVRIARAMFNGNLPRIEIAKPVIKTSTPAN